MKTRVLGRTGVPIPAIGLGCMGLSEFHGPRDDQESIRVIHLGAARRSLAVRPAHRGDPGRSLRSRPATDAVAGVMIHLPAHPQTSP